MMTQTDVHIRTATVGARLDRLPVGKPHRRLLLFIGAGALLDSFDIYLAGGVTAAMRAENFASVDGVAMFMSMTFVGMLIGAAIAGWLGDTFGRKKAYAWNLLLFSAASIAAFFAPNLEILIVLRFIMGIGLGAELVVAGGMLSEFLPPKIRGRWMTILGLIINSGLLLASGLGVIVIPSLGWRAMFLIAGTGGIIVWLMRRNLPESPRWLASHGRHDEAEAIVERMEHEIAEKHGTLPPLSPDGLAVLPMPTPVEKVGYRDLFKGELLRRVILASTCGMAVSICLYGFVTWMPNFLVEQGYSVASSLWYSTLMSIGAPVGAIIGFAVTDRLKRRTTLLLFSGLTILAGLAYTQASSAWAISIIGFSLVCGVYTLTAIILYAYIPELFPTALRLRGTSIASVAQRGIAIATPFVIAALLVSFGLWGPVGLVIGALLFMVATIILIPVETSKVSVDEV